MNTIALLATPAAILAIVNLARRIGMPTSWALLLAVLLGVVFGVSDFLFSASEAYVAAANGLLLGLGAAGVYDIAKVIAPSTPITATPPVTSQPTPTAKDVADDPANDQPVELPTDLAAIGL